MKPLLAVLLLAACRTPTAPCSQPQDFRWSEIPMHDASGAVVDSVQMGFCIR